MPERPTKFYYRIFYPDQKEITKQIVIRWFDIDVGQKTKAKQGKAKNEAKPNLILSLKPMKGLEETTVTCQWVGEARKICYRAI